MRRLLVPQSHRPVPSFWSLGAVMRWVSEATGVRTGRVWKQASQAYAEEDRSGSGDLSAEAPSLGLHYCSEGTVRALDDGGTLSPVSAGD